MFHAAISYQRKSFKLDAELRLDSGSITALIGASGSGKSTLLRLLSGLERPLSGQIYSDDVCWFDDLKNVSLAVQKRMVGMVFQDYALFEHLNVHDNIAYGVERGIQKIVVTDWLSRINLSHKASAYPQDLSGGERQRVALARALAIAPDILLLDEPFSALDVFLRHELRRELQKIISYTQIPVLIATHDLDEARFLADTVYVMSDGKIIQHGPVLQVFQKPETIQAAKILGWQNILPVDSCDGEQIKAAWGALFYKKTNKCTNARIRAIAIPVTALTTVKPVHYAINNSINSSVSSFSVQTLSTVVSYVVEMGGYRVIEVILPDDSRIVLHNFSDQIPVPGQILDVYIEMSSVITLAN